MWGANDPCCRKPMVWPDLDYEPESYLPDGTKKESSDPVQFNHDLFNHYKKLIQIRSSSPALQIGDFETLLADGDVFAFRRSYEEETIIVILNRGTAVQPVTLPLASDMDTLFIDLLNDDRQYPLTKGALTLSVSGGWGCVLQSTK
jgi:glycosidase